MSTMSIINVSVVVSAVHHNPTILHPSFLSTEKIVPQDWEVVDGPVCTPAFSLVGYSNGISFRVEESRLQVIDANPECDGRDSLVAELAGKYVSKLPHVPYKAVGINFVAFLEHADSGRYLLARFLREGSWNDTELIPTSCGVQLTYPISNAALNLSLKSGQSKREGEEAPRKGVILEGNCHAETQSMQEVFAAVDGFRRKLEEASAICARILEENGED